MASTDEFPIQFDYPVQIAIDDGILRSRSIGRKEFNRQAAPSQRLFHLICSGVSTEDRIALEEFYREIQFDYFQLPIQHFAVASGVWHERVFPVHFASAPRVEWAGHDQWNLECDLIEAPGCALASGDEPDPADGQTTAAIVGTVSGSDMIFIYSGYGFIYTGTGTLTLDGAAVTSPKLDVPLGLHRLYVTGGSGTLEVVV